MTRNSQWATSTAPTGKSPIPIRPRATRIPLLSTAMVVEEFNEAEIVNHLEHGYMADLALLAAKFGTMIESVENIEDLHISEIDG